MSKNQFTGTATQRNRNATANFVNLIMTSTVFCLPSDGSRTIYNRGGAGVPAESRGHGQKSTQNSPAYSDLTSACCYI